MKYAITFQALGLLLVYTAVFVVAWPAAQVACLVIAVSFVWVGCIYGMRRPGLFGKTPAGMLRIPGWLLLAPYFALARLTLLLYRATNRHQPVLAEVVPGIWFGRRPSAGDLAAAQVNLAGILDLAAEFPRCSARVAHYRSLPLLDGLPVGVKELESAVRWLDEHRSAGPLLVHCALGHGRTGSVIVAWLVRRGFSPDVDEARRQLQVLRPGFDMSRAQLESVREFVAETGPRLHRLA